jgi:hypothetical protein
MILIKPDLPIPSACCCWSPTGSDPAESFRPLLCQYDPKRDQYPDDKRNETVFARLALSAG